MFLVNGIALNRNKHFLFISVAYLLIGINLWATSALCKIGVFLLELTFNLMWYCLNYL